MTLPKGKKLSAAIEGEELVIRIGIDVLCYAVMVGNGIESGVKVTDEAAFAQWAADNVIDFDTDETGTSSIERVLDALAVEASESAQPFICELPTDEY